MEMKTERVFEVIQLTDRQLFQITEHFIGQRAWLMHNLREHQAEFII